MHVAPPEYGLYPMHERQPAMEVEHASDARVDAFDGIVGGGPFAAALLPHLDEREQGPLPYKLVQSAPRLAQPLVGVDLPAVFDRILLQKIGPSGAPRVVLEQPCRGGVRILCRPQLVCDSEQLSPGIEPGAERRAAPHLLGHMEGAALYARARPNGLGGLGEAAGPVADGHGRFGNPHHDGGPGLGALGARQVPGDDVAARDRDDHDGRATEMQPVQEHDVVDLAREGGYRPNTPYPAEPAPKGGPAGPEIGYRVLRQQPCQERLQSLGGIVDSADGGCAARLAAPPLGPRRCPAVFLHLGAASGASWIIHSRILSLGNFFLEKVCLNRRVKGKSDTLFETYASWTEPTCRTNCLRLSWEERFGSDTLFET